MTIQNYCVATAAQKVDLLALNTSEEASINPIAINQPVPGVGINLSQEATGVVAGAVVTLIGKFIVPQVAMTDPAMLLYLPDTVTYLRTLPWCALQDETIFLPPPPV